MDKASVRAYALRLRKGIVYDKEEILNQISPYLNNKKIVAIYYPLPFELDLRFLEEYFKNIEFVYPAIIEDKIVFRKKGKGFLEGMYHILEPQGQIIEKEEIDLIIVPMLAINKDNYRVGYGKGYYDNYLHDYKGMTLGIIKASLLLDFKEEEHDVRLKDVIIL